VDERRGRRPGAALVVLCAALLTFASGIIWRPGSDPFWGVIYDVVLYNAVYVAGAIVCWGAARATARERTVWICVSLALSCQVLGTLVATVVTVLTGSVPEISVADFFFFASYPLWYVALVGLVRSRVPRFHTSMWLDGIIGALGAAGVTIALLLGSSLRMSGPPTFAAVVNLAYPLSDLLLLAMLVGITAVLGLRMDRTLMLLGAGLTSGLVADFVYMGLIEKGAYVPGGLVDLGWLLAVLAVALAARRVLVDPVAAAPVPTSRFPTASWRVIALPLVCNLVSVGLLGAGWGQRFPPMAAVLAIGCVLAGLVRLTLTFREVRELSGAREQALTDELTGLPNRRALLSAGATALAHAGLDGPVSLLLLDLDRFKDVNDGLGHHAGDGLLRQIGPRLRDALGPHATFARLGGDEFAVLLPETGLAAASDCARELRGRLVEPFAVEDVRVHIDVSIGVTSALDPSVTVIELLRRADIAMYAAKYARAGVHAYDPDTDAATGDRLRVMDELRTALAGDQIIVYLQPQVHASTGEVYGAEALVRWAHPTRGLLSPADLLPAAGQAGLLLPLADRVLELALAAASGWWAQRAVSVSVNLAAPNVTDLDLPNKVAATLARHGLPPCALTLELVEDTLMADPDRGSAVLGQLRDLGVRTSIDDYGTGYSSLAYLRELPLDELKLDRAFTQDLAKSTRAAAIVAHTVALAHALDLRVVAEGVEDAATFERLAELGCDVVQGFLVARPMPVAAFRDWLDARPARSSAPELIAG
jgi:diguanylate cyclase